jgi:hypothetical protein
MGGFKKHRIQIANVEKLKTTTMCILFTYLGSPVKLQTNRFKIFNVTTILKASLLLSLQVAQLQLNKNISSSDHRNKKLVCAK